MNNYTLEQKAAAFDKLLNSCGMANGKLYTYKSREISRPGCPPNEATMIQIPVYKFTIMYEGDCYNFKDVLHKLATT